MKNAILFGNGFNLLSEGCPSWNELLTGISDRKNSPLLNGIPPTFQYEQVYLSPNRNFSDISDEIGENKLKDAVKRRLEKITGNKYYESLKALNVNLFLTTNYDHAFYDNNNRLVECYNRTEKLYSIRRWKKIQTINKTMWLYPIHGDITARKSIMLGLDHYGGSLAKVEEYVKGLYQLTNKDTNKKRPEIPSIKERLEKRQTLVPSEYGLKDSGSGLLSWIDAFFFTNLHIIGITLDFSEIDIWWLLSRRARLAKLGLIENKIYYYPTFPLSEIHNHLSKLRLLERLDVEIIHHKLTDDIETGTIDYPSIYDVQIGNLKKNLTPECM